MSKWMKYGSYELWKESNHGALKYQHDDYIEQNYNEVQPHTFVSFDDFCMGKWQSLD